MAIYVFVIDWVRRVPKNKTFSSLAKGVVMDIEPTTITFTDFAGNVKNVRKTSGGMIPYDVCRQSYTKADGSKGYTTALDSGFLSIMQWDNGTLSIKYNGQELRGFPATVRPTKGE